ncbi:MAG: signal peptidase I [Clostridia bacterium]|nr:signal peptidase I [Clostridia bacterium]
MEGSSASKYSNAISLKKGSGFNDAGEWIQTLSTALIFVVLVFAFVFRVVMVDGHSMDSTLNDRDRLLISSLFADPQNNDIVVVLTDGNNGHPIIKRVIGTEGQTVRIDYAADTVTVTDKNGQSQTLNETYINEQDLRFKGSTGFTDDDDPEITYDQLTGEVLTVTYRVPEGKYFVMGDNRNNSKDSRYDEIGYVTRSQILGEVVLRVLPVKQFGFVG